MLKTRRLRSLCLLAALASASIASADAVRVDINEDNDRKDVLTRGAVNWTIGLDNPTASTCDLGNGIKARLSTKGRLKGVTWKGGLDTGATLACDGVTTRGTLTLTLTGLTPGLHSIALATSSTEVGGSKRAVFASINGQPIQAAPQVERVAHDEEAWTSYTPFTVAPGVTSVVIEMTPTDLNGAPILDGSFTLNGFELDGPDRLKIVRAAVPANGDEHVATSPVVLKWDSATRGSTYRVYLGESEKDLPRVSDGGARQYQVEAPLDPMKTYFWRVDTVLQGGVVIPGDVRRFRVAQLAFPGAEGYGRFARGGRGGRVVEVTNLNDSGPGSLRDAVEQEGPRTIVFRVGGTITLKDRLTVKNPYCTIAGQTAPGDGIAVRGASFGIGGSHDVIMRYVRLRVGDESGKTWDGMGLAYSDHSIIDHCSIAWSIDEGVSSRGAKNITFQRNIITEALNMSVHNHYVGSGKGHSFAGSISGDIGSFHHNLLANNAGRNWSLAGGLNQAGKFAGFLDIRNNVVYNFSHRTNDGGVRMANIVGNYYIPGAASKVDHILIAKMELRLPDDVQEYYVAGNVMEGKPYEKDNWASGAVAVDPQDAESMELTEPFCKSFITEQPAKDAYDSVMKDVGASIPRYDSIDARAIDNTLKRTTTFKGSKTGLPGIIDSQADVGGYPNLKGGDAPADTDHDGMPDWWETQQVLNPNDATDGNAIRTDAKGYTNLERYLNWIVENGSIEPKQ
ncbi:MAG: hypothetical protein QM770_10270 [Tepidisphaeraceae bacterium]